MVCLILVQYLYSTRTVIVERDAASPASTKRITGEARVIQLVDSPPAACRLPPLTLIPHLGPPYYLHIHPPPHLHLPTEEEPATLPVVW